MTERRKILPECPTQNEQSLESRVAAALTSDNMPSGDLEMLIGEVETTAAAFDTAAREQRQRAVDILATPDASAARERALTAELNRDRLRNAIPQLQTKLAGALAAEYRERWLSDFKQAEAERNAAAERFRRIPELFVEIVDIFQQAAEADKECARINQDAPAGEPRYLLSAELTARGLSAFSTCDPPISKNCVLPDWRHSDRNVWPTHTSGMAAAEFAQSIAAHSYHPGADWWRLEEQKAAERRVEAERMNRHYEQMTRAQDERINKEERDRFARA